MLELEEQADISYSRMSAGVCTPRRRWCHLRDVTTESRVPVCRMEEIFVLTRNEWMQIWSLADLPRVAVKRWERSLSLSVCLFVRTYVLCRRSHQRRRRNDTDVVPTPESPISVDASWRAERLRRYQSDGVDSDASPDRGSTRAAWHAYTLAYLAA